jgi:ATP-dependent Clp protease, protease subunit
MTAPYVVEKTGTGERVLDLWSVLNKNRVVYLGDDVNDHTANIIVAQLLYLETESREDPISIYISSRGGSVSAGLSIYDTIKYIESPVHCICLGNASSMAAVILAAGTRGRRYCLPHSTVMIHQVSSGTEGTAADIRVAAKHIERTNNIIADILAEETGKDRNVILEDIDRDYWMTAEEAVEYGIVDKILRRRKE